MTTRVKPIVCAALIAACASGVATAARAQQSPGYPSQSFSTQNFSTQCYSTQGFYSSSSYCPTSTSGGQVTSAVGAASVRATRTFTDTLNDRNEATVGASTNAAPLGISRYAPDAPSLQAYSPIVVAKAPAPAPSPFRIFATGFGGGFNDSAVVSQNGSYAGGLIGVDYRVSPSLLIGGAAGGSSSNVSVAGTASGRTSGFNGSLYAIATFGSFYGQSLTTVSSFSNASTRNVAAAGGIPLSVEQSSFGSFEVRERAEFGRTIPIGELNGSTVKITPFVALEIAQLHLNGHAEFNLNGVGNAAGIVTSGQDIDDVPGFIGARLEASYTLANGMVFTPIVRLAYVHQFANESFAATNFIASGATSFVPNGTLLGRNAAQTKAGFELNVGHGTVVFANFDGLFSSQDQLYGGRAGVRYSF